MRVIDAGQKLLPVGQGQCGSVRLLHFAAASSRPVVLLLEDREVARRGYPRAARIFEIMPLTSNLGAER